MSDEVHFFLDLHRRTVRDYVGRMVNNKVGCMKIAKRYDEEYWDGERCYGYGGYYYDGRWESVARKLITQYFLTETSTILDIGCGKGFLLHEIKKLLPNITVKGLDISNYAIAHAKEEIQAYLSLHDAKERLPFRDKEFDFVYSMGCFHNLALADLKQALEEMQRVGKKAYLMVESYRNEQELFNLQCWALTCQSFFDKASWIWLFQQVGYQGDYEFIYFE